MTACAESEIESEIERLCRDTLSAGPLRFQPIAAGLGARRFFRVELDAPPGSLIARCSQDEDPALRPLGVPPEPPLEPIRSFLEAAGLPVPRCYASEPNSGIELLEDLGDETLELRANATAAAERRVLYEGACNLVPQLQALSGAPEDVPNFGRQLDAALFAYKAEQVWTWLVPWATGKPATPAEREVVEQAFAEIASTALAAPQRLAHRDFKAQNLHCVATSSGERLVMIDLQGAFMAPPEYDLVCLLRDLQVELDPEEIRVQRERVRPLLPDAPPIDEFEQRFALLTLSRVGKDVSRYLYAVQERRDSRYRAFLPTGLRHLRAAARDAASISPAIARLCELFSRLPEPT